MTPFAEHPHPFDPCPKCFRARDVTDPRDDPGWARWSLAYRAESGLRSAIDHRPERLLWTCRICGYVIETTTADVPS